MEGSVPVHKPTKSCVSICIEFYILVRAVFQGRKMTLVPLKALVHWFQMRLQSINANGSFDGFAGDIVAIKLGFDTWQIAIVNCLMEAAF